LAEALAYLDDLGIVQVIPADALWRVNALHAAIQTAPQMQHRRVRMLGEKGGCPPVQLLRSDHQGKCGTLGELYLPEIVIDAADRIFGSRVVQNRVLRATIERSEIQRYQKGFLHLGEMNLFGLHQFPPSACVILNLIINLQKDEDLRCHMIPLRAPSRKVLQSRKWYTFQVSKTGTTARYERLSEESIEQPRINYEQNNGHEYRFAYGVSQQKAHPDDFLNQLVKVDVIQHSARTWFEEDSYPGEPVFVATPDAIGEDEGVVLSVVLDGRKGTSFLLVLDAASFTEIARADVPHHIPFGFHGIYTR
jgi:Retinal pigment epithelial membrane protein